MLNIQNDYYKVLSIAKHRNSVTKNEITIPL